MVQICKGAKQDNFDLMTQGLGKFYFDLERDEELTVAIDVVQGAES